MKRRYKIAAIDFDGTITEDTKLPPLDGCEETLRALKDHGWKLILWTCRAGNRLAAAKNYLRRNGLYELFDAFNENIEPTKYKTSQKILASVYIDDRVIGGFPGWKRVREASLRSRLAGT